MHNEAGGLTRRSALKMSLLAGSAVVPARFAAQAWGWGGSTDSSWSRSWDDHTSTSPTFTPYTTDLPIAPTLVPTSSTTTTDYYDVTMQATQTQIIPGLTTPIWGYNGLYPGPTIKTRKGRQVVVRQRNSLPEAMTVHLHGGYVDGD
ncbi:MAG TPA: multicopper oxidase domain-containing protein, partial [Nocardioides sp.]|nr:multicopper oxidase domain-containing protein [Nocardioides sp.]